MGGEVQASREAPPPRFADAGAYLRRPYLSVAPSRVMCVLRFHETRRRDKRECGLISMTTRGSTRMTGRQMD